MGNKQGLHIGIILDGNRRYAKKRGLVSFKGHNFGANVVEKLFEWVIELKIKELTLYVLSTENLKRKKVEVNTLFRLCRIYFEKLARDKRLKEQDIKINFIGNPTLLPRSLQASAKKLEKMTKSHKNIIINFALAYGGRLEIVEAIKKMIKNKQKISEENLQKNLWLADEPDFIIRTGGVIRTSNFLPWQSIYSEWIFIKKLWPEFTKQDLIKCISEFNRRKRNFGK